MMRGRVVSSEPQRRRQDANTLTREPHYKLHVLMAMIIEFKKIRITSQRTRNV